MKGVASGGWEEVTMDLQKHSSYNKLSYLAFSSCGMPFQKFYHPNQSGEQQLQLKAKIKHQGKVKLYGRHRDRTEVTVDLKKTLFKLKILPAYNRNL